MVEELKWSRTYDLCNTVLEAQKSSADFRIDWNGVSAVLSQDGAISARECQLLWKYVAYGELILDPLLPIDDSDEEDFICQPMRAVHSVDKSSLDALTTASAQVVSQYAVLRDGTLDGPSSPTADGRSHNLPSKAHFLSKRRRSDYWSDVEVKVPDIILRSKTAHEPVEYFPTSNDTADSRLVSSARYGVCNAAATRLHPLPKPAAPRALTLDELVRQQQQLLHHSAQDQLAREWHKQHKQPKPRADKEKKSKGDVASSMVMVMDRKRESKNVWYSGFEPQLNLLAATGTSAGTATASGTGTATAAGTGSGLGVDAGTATLKPDKPKRKYVRRTPAVPSTSSV